MEKSKRKKIFVTIAKKGIAIMVALIMALSVGGTLVYYLIFLTR